MDQLISLELEPAALWDSSYNCVESLIYGDGCDVDYHMSVLGWAEFEGFLQDTSKPLDSTEWLAEYSGVKRRQINKAFFEISEKVILCETQNR